MNQDKEFQNIEPDEQEIDLVEMAQKLWQSRKFILKWVIGGIVFGLIIAFSIPKEFTSGVRMAPEIQSSGNKMSGGLSSLAAMAGINLKSGGNTDALNPLLYPDILNGVPFNVELFDVPVKKLGKDSQTVTLRQYMEEDMRTPWWNAVISLPFEALGAIMSSIKGENEEAYDPNKKMNPYQLSLKESTLLKNLKNRISASVDDKSGVISVSVTMQDPLVATLLADTVVERLKTYVTNYRTDKARHDLEYAQKICDEAKAQYNKTQLKYASYADRNQNISSQAGRIQMERLKNEADLAFDVYNTSCQQLQLAKAKVQEMAPVYTIIQPSTVPVKATKPSKPMIIIGMMFFAFAIAALWVLFGKDFFASFKKKKDDQGPELIDD